MRSELHGEVKAFVEQVVEAMGLDVAVEVSDLEDGSVRVDVQGEEGELLLRRKGEGLDALQHLVNSAYRRDVGRDQRIVIDAMNFRQGKDIELRPREFALLEYLMRNAGRVVSKTMILSRIWDYSFDPRTNVVDVLVYRLREKIDHEFEPKLLQTRRGMGYVLEVPGQAGR